MELICIPALPRSWPASCAPLLEPNLVIRYHRPYYVEYSPCAAHPKSECGVTAQHWASRRNGRNRSSSVIKVIHSECPRQRQAKASSTSSLGTHSVATVHTSRCRDTNCPLQSGVGVSQSLSHHTMLPAADRAGQEASHQSGQSPGLTMPLSQARKHRRRIPENLGKAPYAVPRKVLQRAVALEAAGANEDSETKAWFRRSNTRG
ncbi:hypothetical protein LZ30DRAFT_402725 [Colletotrichum cereale]|nr:hypothetical protein LZ30DRAFT_402725 [Colletotrichum cereale]